MTRNDPRFHAQVIQVRFRAKYGEYAQVLGVWRSQNGP
jgi:hypothetical protein